MRKYSMVRDSLLRTLQILASEDLPVNTENLLKYHTEFDNYRQCGGLIRKLRNNGIIDKKHKMSSSFLDWIKEK